MTLAPNDMTYRVYTRPHNSQNLWVDQEDVNPKVPFTLMTVPKFALMYLWLPWVCDHWPLELNYLLVWTQMQGPCCSMTEDHGWAVSAVQGFREATLGSPLGLAFKHRRSRTWAIFSQHHLHLKKMNIKQTWGMDELRKKSGSVSSMCSGNEKCLESSQLTCAA